MLAVIGLQIIAEKLNSILRVKVKYTIKKKFPEVTRTITLYVLFHLDH